MVLNCGVGQDSFKCPLDCKEIHSITLKEINPEYSLEGPILKLNLQYFGQLMWRTDSLEKTLLLGKIEGRRKRGWQRIRQLDGSPTRWTWVCPSSWLGEEQRHLACCSPWGFKESDMTEWLNNKKLRQIYRYKYRYSYESKMDMGHSLKFFAL